MITSKIFERSQRHEWVEFNLFKNKNGKYHKNALAFINRYLDRKIKSNQKVVSRYILVNQYWEKAE